MMIVTKTSIRKKTPVSRFANSVLANASISIYMVKYASEINMAGRGGSSFQNEFIRCFPGWMKRDQGMEASVDYSSSSCLRVRRFPAAG